MKEMSGHQTNGTDVERSFREYRLALVERCRAELGAALVPGEVGVIVDPRGDSFAQALCRMLGASDEEVTCACVPAHSLAAGLWQSQPDLARALCDDPPLGTGWIVVIGRGAAALALLPEAAEPPVLWN